MPTYEYRCDACSHQFEVFARMSDPAPTACESCGAGELTKVLFPVAVHYKGSGFYSTDYSGSKAASAGDSASTSDTKPASGDSGASSSGSGDSGGSSAPASSTKGTSNDA